MFNVIVAYQQFDRGMGWHNTLPWSLPPDLRHFQQLTHGAIVIMGRRTWESIPPSRRPLKGRENVVLTTQPEQLPGVQTFSSLEHTLDEYKSDSRPIFIIGGRRVYTEALKHPDCVNIYITEIKTNPQIQCDTFFPELPEGFNVQQQSEWQTFSNLTYRFIVYTQVKHLNNL
ncbi:MAG: dihydrofolate reductase [Flavobacteriia bacterium]|nr:dihydrofolate reductase [Flavobacteriia bacterium]